MRMEVVSKQQK